MTLDPNNPFLRQPAHSRAARGIVAATRTVGRTLLAIPRVFYRQFRAAPLGVRVLLIAAAVLGTTVGGYFLVIKRGERVRASQTIVAWQEFEAKAQTGADLDELLPILDRVLALNPTDPTATRRRAALERWTADPDDPAMVSLLLKLHLRNGRTEAAAIEAEKRLAHVPNDYLSHCARAHYLLTKGDRAAAGPHLVVLANPEKEGASPDPSGLLFALKLLPLGGKDPAPVRDFLVRRVLPVLRGERVAQAPPGVQAALLACYAEAFAAGPDAAPVLAEHWAPASRLAALSLEGGTTDKNAKALTLLAEQGPKLANGLARMRAANQVTDAERTTLAAELEERTRAAWRAVLELNPKTSEAFYGLALSSLRTNDYLGARRMVLDGIKTCGDDLRLFQLLSSMLQREDRANEAFALLWQAAERNPQSATWWVMAAEAAIAARRRDVALAACQKARAASPDLVLATYLEAQLWLQAGDAAAALKLFRKFPEDALVRDASAARGYARALVASGESAAADAFVARAEKSGNESDNPAPVTAALRGMFEAAPDKAAVVAERTASLLARWGTDPDLALLRAEALLRQLEQGSQEWDPAATREAARSFDRAASLNPTDLRAAAGLAWVRLRGTNSPDQALRDAAPLVAAEGRLSVEGAEVLGAVYLANNQLDAAARVLELARQSHQVTAGCLVQLARVYHARGQFPEARAVLNAAAGLPRTAREQADYQTAHSLLQRDLR